MNNATRNAPLTYLSVYVPVRVVEWVIFHILISRGFQGTKSMRWVLGVPLGIMEGGVVPVGRPFC
jgi:hypothetical protein